MSQKENKLLRGEDWTIHTRGGGKVQENASVHKTAYISHDSYIGTGSYLGGHVDVIQSELYGEISLRASTFLPKEARVCLKSCLLRSPLPSASLENGVKFPDRSPLSLVFHERAQIVGLEWDVEKYGPLQFQGTAQGLKDLLKMHGIQYNLTTGRCRKMNRTPACTESLLGKRFNISQRLALLQKLTPIAC